MRKVHLASIGMALLLAAFAVLPEIALARAGGGGGGGGGRGGGIAGLVALPFFLAYSALVTALLAQKRAQARALLERLEALDSAWDLDAIKARVEETFFCVQQAWDARDQDVARDYMSPRLYAKHKRQTDDMIRQGRRNVLEKVNLIKSQVVGVRDYTDDTRDRLLVHIEGSMIDYTIDDEDGHLVSGNRSEPEHFTEMWSFVRGEMGWVLDEIEQDAGLLDIALADCRSQQAGA